MKTNRRLSWGGPPLALQILGLLLGGLVVAQLVTLFLTLVLPPAPEPQYGLDDIATALADASADASTHGLQRLVQSGPPDVSGGGWLVSERSRGELARLLRVPEERVSLAFYTPLPFAGTAGPRQLALAGEGPMALQPAAYVVPARPSDLLRLTQFAPPAGGMGAGFGRPGLLRVAPPPRDTLPPGTVGDFARRIDRRDGTLPLDFASRQGPLIGVERSASDRALGTYIPGDQGAALPSLLRGAAADRAVASASAPALPTAVANAPALPDAARIGAVTAGGLPSRAPIVMQPLLPPTSPPPMARVVPPLLAPQTLPQAAAPARAAPVHEPTVRPLSPPIAAPLIEVPALRAPVIAPPAALAAPHAPDPTLTLPPTGPPIAPVATRRGLFGLAPAPFVEGDFVAALRLPDGRWAVVQPAAQPFPNSWQRRVLLWFVFSLALVGPLGWLFARRLVKPLDRFAHAAEQLGRDPTAVIGPLDGPAEMGRAAHAFNLMQNRLRTFVDDRTAMIGAISHDLRTPLTRMRFRIEDVPDDVRDGLLEEVDEMEAMIAQVIAFIRDASMPGARERLDLGTIVEEAVADARLVGGHVVIEQAEPAPVEVDVLGVRRVIDNLLENAVKYGERARIRLRIDEGSAVAEILDDGPGMAEEELDRAFEPFYRSDAARQSEKSGSGLGLAVCRSIARAHGGDVQLRRSGEGFLAEMRVPLAYGSEPMPA